LWSAGVGGLMAVAVLGWRRFIRKSQAQDDSIAYAPAIVIGVWLALIPKG